MQNEPAGQFAGSIAAEVRAEMGRQRLEVGALADHLEVSRRTASRLINGHQPIDLTELELIGEFLEIDPLDLIQRTRRTGTDAA